MPVRPAFEIGAHSISAGARQTVDLPVSVLSDHTPVTMSVHVVHGRRPGPTLFVSAAIHGDEIIGVEIARRLLRLPKLGAIRGTLLVVPIVNAFGFLNRSRYLPDRRDLNRTFPGSERGSLAGRLAHLFMNEVVLRSNVGIDLHSAAIHRTNLPQVRVSASKEDTAKLAEAFGAPMILMSEVREGSLRQAAQRRGVDILLYEAGEGLRFDELSVRVGFTGVVRVMHALGMVSRGRVPKGQSPSVVATSSFWIRAPAGGLLRAFRTTGDQVDAGEVLGIVSDPFGETETEVSSDKSGVIIGRTNLPVVNEGDGLFHIATTKSPHLETTIDTFASQLEDNPLFDEDEII